MEIGDHGLSGVVLQIHDFRFDPKKSRGKRNCWKNVHSRVLHSWSRLRSHVWSGIYNIVLVLDLMYGQVQYIIASVLDLMLIMYSHEHRKLYY